MTVQELLDRIHELIDKNIVDPKTATAWVYPETGPALKIIAVEVDGDGDLDLDLDLNS